FIHCHQTLGRAAVGGCRNPCNKSSASGAALASPHARASRAIEACPISRGKCLDTGSSVGLAWHPGWLARIGLRSRPGRHTKLPLAWPELIQCVGIVEYSALHHVGDVRRPMDVLERIRVQNHQIGELARLDGSDLMLESEHARSALRGH